MGQEEDDAGDREVAEELFVRLRTSLGTNGHDGKYGPKQKLLLRQNKEV